MLTKFLDSTLKNFLSTIVIAIENFDRTQNSSKLLKVFWEICSTICVLSKFKVATMGVFAITKLELPCPKTLNPNYLPRPKFIKSTSNSHPKSMKYKQETKTSRKEHFQKSSPNHARNQNPRNYQQKVIQKIPI